MQLVVKYSINLELQIYKNLSDIVFCDQPFKTGQDKTFLNLLEELESQWDLTC